MKWINRVGKWVAVGSALTAMGAGGAGCLTRPVGSDPPTTKVNFTSTISQQQVDKVDLLFAIDNSASMGDKQEILKDAVPQLLNGLLRPYCVDQNSAHVKDEKTGKDAVADPNSSKELKFGCPAGTEPEFKPVTDMHIGIVSSSLGTMGGDVCPEGGRNNDKAHLLNYVDGGAVPVTPNNFLAWYPSNEENADKVRHPDPAVAVPDFGALQESFQKLVVGVAQNGCGLEAQLESVYRFLIQPDPWESVTVAGGSAVLNGIDTTVLAQRRDFLRPDSLVAIVMLTDEDDSSADPLSVGGQGWAFMNQTFPGSEQARTNNAGSTAPKGTSACATDPGSPDCTSCGFAKTCKPGDPGCEKIKNDPNCVDNKGYYAAGADSLNVRFHRMKERYGIDPQYPLRRYVDGLTKQRVPDRVAEHPIDPSTKAISNYVGAGKCTNPLFAAKLPKDGDDYCNLALGTRSPDLVFFAVVGGVPQDLLHFDPKDSEKSLITADDWVKILGKDPEHFHYEGINIHMKQSVNPRDGVPGPSTQRGENGDLKQDAVGRDYVTNGDDLQYACTFDLPTPRNCANDPSGSCDCKDSNVNPPLCGAQLGTQVRAKAYPTIREFSVVRALGQQGIISSLCPLDLTKGNESEPTYGYNPAVKVIVDRLKNALTTQCLPQQLTRDETTKEVPCLVLAQLGDVSDTCQARGLQKPPAEIESKFREQQRAASGNVANGGVDLSAYPLCVVPQLTVDKGASCKDASDIGWCYVENSDTNQPAGRCPQALLFSEGSGGLSGARFSLQCIQQFQPGQAAGDVSKQ
ncbi:hypothetical protein AKJ09_10148 [Labilithrix luteola]|uniref:Lipoprotein n=1 Tax=Labilithrix luteola TaxID=1391654 RepID=A0A0K1QDH3_9BACT|nr:hypothetical protein [Labilithrix luteola]AKV03485.1 hypothetical protein AKJ09_10148 [Labilithrix luteola]